MAQSNSDQPRVLPGQMTVEDVLEARRKGEGQPKKIEPKLTAAQVVARRLERK